MIPGDEDPRLTAFLAAQSDDEAESALAALFDEATERALVDSVRRGLFGSSRRLEDADDIASDARVRLIRRLWTLRRDGGERIEDFTAYVAATATRACYAHLRARFPARTRFRNQVRYCVSRHPDTTIESDAHGVWQCRSRAPIRAVPPSGSARQFLDAPGAFLTRARIDAAAPLPSLLAAVLAKLDESVELDRLVGALADVLGVADAAPVGLGRSDDHPLERVADPSPGAAQSLSDREALQALWREVLALPPNQRAALLLNLRDPDGGSALHALPATGILTRPGLAQALGLGEHDLAALWDELPLDDLTIAGRLGLTRQQVINLRKSARARLARRTERPRT